MQITITGPRGGGKTTVAILIAKTLRKLGMKVSFVSRTHEAKRFLEIQSASDLPDAAFSQPFDVVIVDGIEPQDENDVGRGITNESR